MDGNDTVVGDEVSFFSGLFLELPPTVGISTHNFQVFKWLYRP